MNVEVRLGIPEDLDAIHKVYYETWMATYPNEEHGITEEDIRLYIGEKINGADRERRAELLRNPPAHVVQHVALVEGSVVGVSGLIRDERGNKLKSLYILPEYQGKGVGTALWNAALQWFDTTKKIVVHVAVFNTQAITFYAKLGFVDSGKRFAEERFRFKSGSIIPEMEMVIEPKA